jgi:tripartite-type tricarboxylate transporter receptor subunit TctC
MTPTRLMACLGWVCTAALSSIIAHAQDYPSRSIQFIVPSSAGTTGDQLARLLGPRLTQRWNVPVVVENKVGAGGIIGIEAAARAQPDGYSFLFAATSFSTLPALRAKLPYDPLKNFAPIVLLGASPLVLIVANKVPAKTVREFVDYAKKQPAGSLNYASPGLGGVQHLTMELFMQEAGIKLLHVPYKSMAGALNDLAAGHVQAGVVVLQTALPLVQSGKMRALAVLSAERVAPLPNVPTMAEAGVPKVVSEAWFGVMAPAGTPTSVLQKMNTELNQLLTLPDVKEALDKVGVDTAGGKPERLEALVASDLRMWTQVVKKANIAPE